MSAAQFRPNAGLGVSAAELECWERNCEGACCPLGEHLLQGPADSRGSQEGGKGAVDPRTRQPAALRQALTLAFEKPSKKQHIPCLQGNPGPLGSNVRGLQARGGAGLWGMLS